MKYEGSRHINVLALYKHYKGMCGKEQNGRVLKVELEQYWPGTQICINETF